MTSSTRAKASPFTRAVVSSMRKLYPEALADKSFDNTGLLLEAPSQPSQKQRNLALLTIDLTRAVCDEAIDKQASVVVAYHPIIFRPLKSLTLGDSQQESLLRLVAAGISVYSPHTAVDAAPGGLSDWLADIVTGTNVAIDRLTDGAEVGEESQEQDKQKTFPHRPGPGQRTYSKPTYPTPPSSGPDSRPSYSDTKHARNTILPSPNPPPGTADSAGIGRLVRFSEQQPLTQLIERIARGVGTPAGFPVAIPQGASVEKIQISTVAVCAGSGGSVLREGDAGKADLWLTGELGHHEALAVTERGGCVVTLSHSNTERGYLGGIMQALLQKELETQWSGRSKTIKPEYDEAWTEHLNDESVEVDVSEYDRDPFGIVLLQGSEVEGTRLDDGEVVSDPDSPKD